MYNVHNVTTYMKHYYVHVKCTCMCVHTLFDLAQLYIRQGGLTVFFIGFTDYYHFYIYDSRVYYEGSGPILVSNVLCNGSEPQLLDCPHEAPDSHCSHSPHARTHCTPCEY